MPRAAAIVLLRIVPPQPTAPNGHRGREKTRDDRRCRAGAAGEHRAILLVLLVRTRAASLTQKMRQDLGNAGSEGCGIEPKLKAWEPDFGEAKTWATRESALQGPGGEAELVAS